MQIKSGINPAGQQQRNMKPITHLEVLKKLNLISRPICNLMEDGEGPDVERKQLANRALRLRQADGLRTSSTCCPGTSTRSFRKGP